MRACRGWRAGGGTGRISPTPALVISHCCAGVDRSRVLQTHDENKASKVEPPLGRLIRHPATFHSEATMKRHLKLALERAKRRAKESVRRNVSSTTTAAAMDSQ